jgi:hypothetical protein
MLIHTCSVDAYTCCATTPSIILSSLHLPPPDSPLHNDNEQGTREDLNAVWIGWLGQEIPEEDQPFVREKLLREYNAVPVFLSDELVHKYYNGACAPACV